MIPAFNERFCAKLYKRKINSNDYELTPSVNFKYRIASAKEKTAYQSSSGIITQSQGLYIVSSRLPIDIKVDDRIFTLNKYWLVESVGYYINETNIMTNELSDEKLLDTFVKGIKLV